MLRLFRPLATRFPGYRWITRRLLFALSPEKAQALAEAALHVRPLWRLHAAITSVDTPLSHREFAGIGIRNPIGLAAGFDKRCEYLGNLTSFGFGYMVCGTMTRYPRPGNPRPRLLRLPEREALLNALGFPGGGALAGAAQLQRYMKFEGTVPVIASIAALGVEDAKFCLKILEPWVAGVELNISSPNTQGVQEYQQPESLARLLDVLNGQRTKPLFVKLPPWRDEASREAVLKLVRVCATAGTSGVTAFNTMPVHDTRLAMRSGGLSGQPLLEGLISALPDVRRDAGAGLIVNACGGIGSGEDAWRALKAGADTVQLYTALVYQGPGLVNSMAACLEKHARAEMGAQ